MCAEVEVVHRARPAEGTACAKAQRQDSWCGKSQWGAGGRALPEGSRMSLRRLSVWEGVAWSEVCFRTFLLKAGVVLA